MVSHTDPSRADRVDAEALARLDALSIAVKRAPAEGPARRLAYLKGVEDWLRAAGWQTEESRSWWSKIEASSALVGKILAFTFSFLAAWGLRPILSGAGSIPLGEALAVVFAMSVLSTAAIFYGLDAGFVGWSIWKARGGGPSEAVRSRIEDLERTLLVEKQNVYVELADHPEVRRQLFGNASGLYPIEVTKRPGGGNNLAFRVKVPSGRQRPDRRSVEIDGLTIPVEVVVGEPDVANFI